jgi:hypothetical protein
MYRGSLSSLCHLKLSSFILFALCLSSCCVMSYSKEYGDGLSHCKWRQAMVDEICALPAYLYSGPHPPHTHTHKIIVGCCWIFTINVYQMLKLIHSRPIWYLKGYSSPRLLFNTGSTETWHQQILPKVNFE